MKRSLLVVLFGTAGAIGVTALAGCATTPSDGNGSSPTPPGPAAPPEGTPPGRAPVNVPPGPVAPPSGSVDPVRGGEPPSTPVATPPPAPPSVDPAPAGPKPFGEGAGEVAPTAGPIGGGNPMSATGLDRHDALYCGEWQKTTKPGDTIYYVKGGKVVWSYSLNTSGGNEFGDCTLTSYSTVTYPLKNSGAFEMKVDLAKGKGGNEDIVWQYKQDGGSEVHSVQPIGKDRALVMQNSSPPKLLLIDKTKAKVCTSASPGGCVIQMWSPPLAAGGVHGMFRHVRMLANGNLLIPYTGNGSHLVVEYKPQPAPSTELTEVWRYDSGGSPWAAVRLKNGNTLVSGNSQGWVREVTHDNPPQVVWEMKKEDYPVPMHWAQGAMRLANGNTLIASWCGVNLKNTADWYNSFQYFEVTHDMPPKVVWQLKQWTNPDLGPGSSMQALDEPGVPENLGELAR